MSAGHTGRLYRAGASVVHRLPPHCKLVAMLAFVIVVVATPRGQLWAFGVYAVLLAGVATAARVPALFLVRRLLVELPFVAFALLLPFVASGERIEVLGVHVSSDGLLGAWNILAKGTLGVAASVLLAATTEPRALLLGLERLRLPRVFTQIATFMLRYIDVILDEMHRMKIARESRGFEARSVRQMKVVAQSAGALFIRSYERGERVYLAMVSRGYTGTMPQLAQAPASAAQWGTAACLPVLALVAAGCAMVAGR